MVSKIICAALILFSTFMGIKHGWQALTIKPGATGPGADLFKLINLSDNMVKIIGVLTIISAVMILFPQTFVAGNYLNAAIILFLTIMFLRAGAIKPALIEIPFLLMPLLMIYLKYPLR